MSKAACHICHSPRIAYTDVLELNWCRVCYDEIYLGSE